MSFLNDLGLNMPSYQSGGWGSNLLYIFLFVIFAGALIFGCWWYLENRKYKYNIEIYENLGGTQYQRTGKDKAKIVKLGDGGEEIMYLKRRKIFRNAYGKKMGHNLYWFAIGQDGYWYNIKLGDLDAKQGMLDIEPIDRDMRYMHVAIRKNISERYRKNNFMEKYGIMLMAGLFLLIMIGGIWFLLDKMGEHVHTLSSTTDTANRVLQGNKDVLTALDNIMSSSGIEKVSPAG